MRKLIIIACLLINSYSYAIPFMPSGGGSSTPEWSDIQQYPSACPTGQVVTGVGQTLTCAALSGTGDAVLAATQTYTGANYHQSFSYWGVPYFDVTPTTSPYTLMVGPKAGHDSAAVWIHGNYGVDNSGAVLNLGGKSFATTVNFNVRDTGIGEFQLSRSVCGIAEGFSMRNLMVDPNSSQVNIIHGRNNGNIGLRAKGLMAADGAWDQPPYYNINAYGSMHLHGSQDDGENNPALVVDDGDVYLSSSVYVGKELILQTEGQCITFPDSTRQCTAEAGTGGSGLADVFLANDQTFTGKNSFTDTFNITNSSITLNNIRIHKLSSWFGDFNSVGINTNPHALSYGAALEIAGVPVEGGRGAALSVSAPYDGEGGKIFIGGNSVGTSQTKLQFLRTHEFWDPGRVDFNMINSPATGMEMFMFGGSNNYDRQPSLYFSTNTVIMVGCGGVGEAPCRGQEDFTKKFQVIGDTKLERDVIISSAAVSKTLVHSPSDVLSLEASSTMPSTNTYTIVQSTGGAITLTSNPQIADGRYSGQIIILRGNSDVHNVTLISDNGLLLNSGLPFTLGYGDTLQLIYDGALDKWLELSRSDNNTVS